MDISRMFFFHIFENQLTYINTIIFCSTMEWCQTSIIGRIFVLNLFNNFFANIETTIGCGQMKWSLFFKIYGIFSLNLINNNFANFPMIILHSNYFQDCWKFTIINALNSSYYESKWNEWNEAAKWTARHHGCVFFNIKFRLL